MKKHYFLGLSAGRRGASRQLFTFGRTRDYELLSEYLSERYQGEAVLCKNGRSALALALKAVCNRGDKVLVNGFTCYAVYEAVKAAGCEVVFADIDSKDLNIDFSKKLDKNVKCVIIQNTLGNAVDITEVEKFAKNHGIVIIEDLAHSVGARYSDGREAGTVGAATVLSFGKEKAVDAISGGAVVLRSAVSNLGPRRSRPSPRGSRANPRAAALRNARDLEPALPPRLSDYLRERWYPAFAAVARVLSYVHLSGVWLKFLTKIHWIERSADNRLDLKRKMPKFEAKIALSELKKREKAGVLREFYLVDDREKVLKELREAGYYFDGLWYEKPVSPVRYYKKVHFNEDSCPVATEVAEHIVNLPTYYSKAELKRAREIIKKHAWRHKNGQ